MSDNKNTNYTPISPSLNSGLSNPTNDTSADNSLPNLPPLAQESANNSNSSKASTPLNGNENLNQQDNNTSDLPPLPDSPLKQTPSPTQPLQPQQSSILTNQSQTPIQTPPTPTQTPAQPGDEKQAIIPNQTPSTPVSPIGSATAIPSQPTTPPQPPPSHTQPPTPPPPPASPTAATAPSGGKRILTVIIGFLIILLLSFATVMTVSAYTDIKLPFISDDISRKIKIYFAKLPLLPKTREQVFLATLSKAKTVSSFDNNVSAAIKLQPKQLSQLGVISLDGEGKFQVEYKNEDLKIDADLTLALSILENTYPIEASYKNIDADHYIKIKSLPLEKIITDLELDKTPSFYEISPILQLLNTKVINRWIVFKSTGLNTQAQEELNKKQAQQTFQSFYANLLDQSIEDIKKMNFKKTAEGYEFYKTYNQQELKRLIQKGFLKEGKILSQLEKKELDDIISGVEYLTLRIIISKDYFLKKLVTNLKMDYINTSPNDPDDIFNSMTINLSIVSSFSAFNQSKNIQAPANAVSLQELFNEIQLNFQSMTPRNQTTPQASKTARIQITSELIKMIDLYRRENAKYPKNLTDLSFSPNNVRILQQAADLSITYVPSRNQDAYLLYFPNTEFVDTFYVIKNGKVLSQNMTIEQLTQELDNMQREVLGTYSNRLVEEIKKLFQKPSK